MGQLAAVNDGQKGAKGFFEKAKIATAALLLAAVFTACSVEPQPIRYGQDECAHCRMSILEPKFSAELLTKKGKAFKFDDVSCMVGFLKTGDVAEADIHSMLVSNYAQPGEWLDAKTAVFVQHPDFKSPMAGNAAAFREAGSSPLKGVEKKWEELGDEF